MNFVKSFWSSNTKSSSNGDIQSQSNVIYSNQAANFSAASYTTTTTTAGNSIIITTVPATPQNTQQIDHQNRQNIAELQPAQMVSPADSFHSATSHFDQANHGKGNKAFGGKSDINNNNNNNNNNNSKQQKKKEAMQTQPSQGQVVREQYWSWNWPWQRWNAREKIFLIVIIVLSLCCLALISVLSVVVSKKIDYDILSTLCNTTSKTIS